MVGSKTTMTRSPFPFLAAAWIWLIVLGQSPFHVAGDPYWTSENMSPEEVLQAFVAARNGTVGLNRKWNRTATAAQRRMARMKQLESDPERKERIHRVLRNTKPQIEQLVPMTPDELVRMEEQNPNLRARKVSQSYSPYSLGNLADPGADYSMWAQAFRMLGGFIDCGHNKFSDSHKGNSHNYNFENKDGSCSRWMMWAAVSLSLCNSNHFCAVLYLTTALCFHTSTLTRTTREKAITNTEETIRLEPWIAINPIPIGNSWECTVRSSTSLLSRFRSIFGPWTTMITLLP